MTTTVVTASFIVGDGGFLTLLTSGARKLTGGHHRQGNTFSSILGCQQHPPRLLQTMPRAPRPPSSPNPLNTTHHCASPTGDKGSHLTSLSPIAPHSPKTQPQAAHLPRNLSGKGWLLSAFPTHHPRTQE